MTLGVNSGYSLGEEIAKSILEIRSGKHRAYASSEEVSNSSFISGEISKSLFWSLSGKEKTDTPKPVKEINYGIQEKEVAEDWVMKKIWVDLDNTIKLIPKQCEVAKERLTTVVLHAKKRAHVTTELARSWTRYVRLNHCFDMALARDTIKDYD